LANTDLRADIGTAPFFEWRTDLPALNYNTECIVLGPVGSYAETDNASFRAVRPLWSNLESEDAVAHDFIWPLCISRAGKARQHSRYVLWYNYNNDPEQKKSYGLIPILFFKDYPDHGLRWGLFPVYGSLNDFLGYDEWRFALFPLYSSTKKLSKKSHSFIWPLINYETGDKSDRFRFLPFYAYNHRHGISLNRSYIWPIFNKFESLKEGSDDSGWMLWPLVGHKSVNGNSTWSFLWPFFSHSTGDDGDVNKANYLWPFYQYEDRMVETGLIDKKMVHYHKRYFWPVWGKRTKGANNSSFFLWPLGSSRSESFDDGKTEMDYFLPFYYRKDTWNEAGSKRETYRKVWPFWSSTDRDGRCETRILDLWPYRNMAPIDRNWAPFWTLFHSVETKTEKHWDFLWGLVFGNTGATGEKSWGINPFYRTKTWFQEGVDDNSSKIEYTEDDILLGLVKLTSSKETETRLRLFWCLEL